MKMKGKPKKRKINFIYNNDVCLPVCICVFAYLVSEFELWQVKEGKQENGKNL